MGFRNPFRVQLDENDVAYVSDYSPDSQVPQQFRGPAGTGRYRDRPTPGELRLAHLLQDRPPVLPLELQQFDSAGRDADAVRLAAPRASRTTRTGTSRAVRPSSRAWRRCRRSPTRTSGTRTATTTPATPLGTPCFGNYGPNALADPPAPGSTTPCPRLFPELYTGGVGPHGIAKYHYDPANPNPTKFPPYYDNSVILGEFTQDTMREVKLDSQNRILKVNRFLDCGAVGSARRSSSSATTRWTCSGARTARSTC